MRGHPSWHRLERSGRGQGFDVIGFDEDATLVARLNLGGLIVEPGLPELFDAQRTSCAAGSICAEGVRTYYVSWTSTDE
jgi:hypothetical protein